MAVAAGAGLILLVRFLAQITAGQRTWRPEGWALAFGVVGFILTTTGLHLTLTLPLAASGFPLDNIIFGEPSRVEAVLDGTTCRSSNAFAKFRAGGCLLTPGEPHTITVRIIEDSPRRPCSASSCMDGKAEVTASTSPVSAHDRSMRRVWRPLARTGRRPCAI
jgi:Protein of unknown function (DUF981)